MLKKKKNSERLMDTCYCFLFYIIYFCLIVTEYTVCPTSYFLKYTQNREYSYQQSSFYIFIFILPESIKFDRKSYHFSLVFYILI